MKNRVLKALIGAAAVMIMTGGCTSQPEKTETAELQTLEILDIEEVSEIPAELESEDAADATEEETPAELILGAGQEETDTLTEESTDRFTESETEDAVEPGSEAMAAAQGKAGRETEAELLGETAVTDKKTDEKEPEIETEMKTAFPGVQETTETERQEQTELINQTGKLGQTEETDLSEEKKGTENRNSTEDTSENEKLTDTQESSSQTEAAENCGETEGKAGVAYSDETEKVSESETESAYPDETEKVSEAEIEPTYLDETENIAETEAEAETEQSVIGLHVAADRVNVREEPSTEAEKITTLDVGEEVLCLSEEEDWSKIRFESDEGIRDGYVKTEFLADKDQLYVAKEKVNVRKETSTESDKVGALEAGDETVVLEVADGWAKVRFYTETGVIDAYVKAEFLEQAEQNASEDLLAQEAGQLAAQLTGQAESAEADGQENELGATAVTESEAETENASEAETFEESKSRTEGFSETEIETEGSSESELGMEASSEAESEAESEERTVAESETEALALPESELESSQELASEQGAVALELTEGAEAQFQLAKLLFPEATKAGILYSEKNTIAAAQLEAYETLAGTYGMELTAVSIEEEADIDFAASELVGSVDCIFCIDDSVINGLLQTVCAYANEVEIPVIGISGEQVEKGSLIAYAGGKLYWNTEKAGKLGKNSDELNGNQLVEY